MKKPQRQKSVLDKRDRKIKNLQKKISALKRSANQIDEDESDDEDPNTSAGDAIGGREERKWPRKGSRSDNFQPSNCNSGWRIGTP
jgi:hypothetical protein